MTKAADPAALDTALESARQQGETLGGPFAPGIPLTPYDGVSGLPRAWDFPTGYNIKARADRDGRIDFRLLKALVDSYDVANMCINHRIDDVRSLNWSIRSADWVEQDNPEDITAARAALKKPDGRTPFRSWLATYLQDVLRYDAGALYRRRNMIGDVCGLEVVSGTTIAPVLDYYGRTPQAPAPAYVQYVAGQPWEWLTTDDLIYVPFRPQPDSPYGISPLETVLLTANTHMRFQKHYLDWFTEGNMPEGFATAPENITTPDQIEAWQAYWDAMNTDTRTKHKLKMMPHGTTLEFPKDKSFDPAFPLYLMRIVCAAYHVTPNDLGFTEDVNRATGDTQVDVQFRIGTLPLLRHVEDILTSYLQDDLGLAVVFEFDTGQETEDRVATAQADQIYIQNGVISVDEVREREYGLATDAERPTPRFIFSARQGPIPLRSLLDVAGPIDPQTAGPSDLVPLDTTPFEGTPGVLADKSPGSPQFAKAPTDPDEPRHPELETPVPGSGVVGAPPAPAAPAEQDPEVVKELARWRSNTLTRLARGQRPRPFEPQVMDDGLVEAVWKQLQHVRTKDQADFVFDQIRKASTKTKAKAPAKWNPLDPKGDMSAFGDVDEAEQSDLENQIDAELGDPTGDPEVGDTEQSMEESDLLPTELGPGAAGLLALPAAQAASGATTVHRLPKGKGVRTEVEEATPQQTVDRSLVDYWAPKISDAMGGLITEERIKDLYERARTAVTTWTDVELAREVDNTALADQVKQMWSDAYGVGTLAANVSIKGPSDDWTNWTPGNSPMPSDTDLGWRSVMASANLSIQGITDTAMEGMGRIIDQGVQDGLATEDLAAKLRDYITDPSRADMIAQTESARMLSTASMSTYRAAGLTEYDLVISDGACDECVSLAESNPYSVYGDVPVPVHPRCRCSVAPTKDAQEILFPSTDGLKGEMVTAPDASPEDKAQAAGAFHTAFEGAMSNSPFTAFVSHYSQDEIAQMRDIVLMDNGKAGMLVKDHGDGRIEGSAVFNQSSDKNVGRTLLDEAVNKYGVNYVECYGPFLPEVYGSLGFKTVEQYPFDRSMAADNWNYDKFGEPDYHMMTMGGQSYAKLRSDAGLQPAEATE